MTSTDIIKFLGVDCFFNVEPASKWGGIRVILHQSVNGEWDDGLIEGEGIDLDEAFSTCYEAFKASSLPPGVKGLLPPHKPKTIKQTIGKQRAKLRSVT